MAPKVKHAPVTKFNVDSLTRYFEVTGDTPAYKIMLELKAYLEGK
jgi:hypothetical protein